MCRQILCLAMLLNLSGCTPVCSKDCWRQTWYLFGRFEEHQLEQQGFGANRQAANLAIGDTVDVWVDYDPDQTPFLTGLNCIPQVAAVVLESSAPEVVAVAANERLSGKLTALSRGSAVIVADITITTGARVNGLRAELYQFDRRFLPIRTVRVQ